MIKFQNLDADESIFFSRQLEYVKAQTYDVQYAELKARKLIPVSTEVDPGAETIKYEQFDQVGIAQIVSSYGDDLPRADIKGKEFISPIRSLASAYGYNLQEVRAARYAGKPLATRKAAAAKRAILQKENAIAFTGDSENGLLGFINHPNISSTTVANDGTGSATTFASKTADKVLRDLNKLVNYIVENTKGVEIPDTLLLPVAQFNYISTTPWSTTGDGTTILQLFLKNSPYIKNVDWVNELKGAGSAGTDRMIAYQRNPMKLTLEIPQDFEQLDVQQKNLEFVVPCHSRIGGCIVYYPLSVAYVDGI